MSHAHGTASLRKTLPSEPAPALLRSAASPRSTADQRAQSRRAAHGARGDPDHSPDVRRCPFGGLREPPPPPMSPACRLRHHAPVAQLDRAPDYESGGQRFESFRARHFPFRASPMRWTALSLIVALTGCTAPGGPYPSLQPRAAEAIDPRVPVERPMNDRPVTAALAGRLSAL